MHSTAPGVRQEHQLKPTRHMLNTSLMLPARCSHPRPRTLKRSPHESAKAHCIRPLHHLALHHPCLAGSNLTLHKHSVGEDFLPPPPTTHQRQKVSKKDCIYFTASVATRQDDTTSPSSELHAALPAQAESTLTWSWQHSEPGVHCMPFLLLRTILAWAAHYVRLRCCMFAAKSQAPQFEGMEF